MAAKLPCTRILPWIWVVEAIASSDQVDTSLLIDLVKETPVISDDVGKEAKEVVSLRILESLVVQGNQNNNNDASALGEKFEFDPSDNCEDVLRCILQEMSASNLKIGGPEMLKWDLQSFIARKKACLPRFALQKLKDAIREGSHSVLTSLKERSGIAIRTPCDDHIPVDDATDVQRLKENDKGIVLVAINRNLSSSATGNGDDQLQENLAGRNLLPAKRNWKGTTAENLDRQTCEHQILVDDCCDSYAEAAKKLKQDVNVTGHEVVQNSIASPTHGLLTNSPERVVGNIEIEGYNVVKEAEVLGMDHIGSPHETVDQYAASKRLKKRRDDIDDEPLHCQLQAPNDDNGLTEISGDLQGQTNCVDEDSGGIEGFERRKSDGIPQGVIVEQTNLEKATSHLGPDIQQNATTATGAKVDILHNLDFETTSDSDEYHDKRTDIDSKKNAFLSSQCSYGQDSLATHLNHCVKCNKGGQLLVCSSNTCPLVVHENCLGSAANFDGNGKFYCPFCAYSRAISEYLEVKKQASLARKDLAIFIGLKKGSRPNLSMRSHRQEQNQFRADADLCQFRADADLCEQNEENNLAGFRNVVSHCDWKPNVEDKQEAEPSVSCGDDNPPCGDKVVDLTHVVPHTLLKGNVEREDIGQECQSPGRQGEEQIKAQTVHKSDTDILSHENPKFADRNGRHGRIREQKKVSLQPESTLSPDPSSFPSTESSEEEEDDKSAASKYSIRLRKPQQQYTYPPLPQLRRKKLPWTKAEEEKLKEGVQRLSSAQDRNIPWKQILEFGGDTFHKGRTTIDLKDKWRNICKGSPKPK